MDKEIEELSELVHKAYCKYYKEKKGEDYWTKGDYSKLDEATKEYDRRTVRTILDAGYRKPLKQECECKCEEPDYEDDWGENAFYQNRCKKCHKLGEKHSIHRSYFFHGRT